MIIKGMDHFQDVCKKLLVKKYNEMYPETHIDVTNVFVVWANKSLQNYKGLLSTTVDGDGVYVEYTFNGDKHELYQDFYIKADNECIVEEPTDSYVNR